MLTVNDLRAPLKARLPHVITDLRSKVAASGADAPRREAGYTISNALGDEAVIRIYDEIWYFGINAIDLVAELDSITAPAIRVEINSPGGDVFDGIAIYNALRNHPAQVTTRVDGIAASIASVIFQAGDRRVVQPSGQVMIHNAWTVAAGDANDMDDVAVILRQQDAVIAGIYAARSGRPVEEFRALMDAETWMTAERAVEEGLADEIVDTSTAASNRLTLHDQIAGVANAAREVLAEAERVNAQRAATGEGLGNKVTASLDGLRDVLAELPNASTSMTQEHEGIPPELAAQLARNAERLAAHHAQGGA